MDAESVNSLDDYNWCPTREDHQLKRLLCEWKLDSLCEVLKECGVTYERLQYLKKEDIEEILPGRKNIGLRAEIREKFKEWKNKYPNPETPVLQPQKRKRITHWIEAQDKQKQKLSLSPSLQDSTVTLQIAAPMPQTSQRHNQSESSCSQYQNVREILHTTNKGQSIIKFFEDNKYLDEFNRKELLNCVAENFFDILANEYKIPRPCEMEKMAEEIVEIFPTEDKDTYYISRRAAKRPNPMGRLFNRFNNLNRNRRQPKKRLERLNGESQILFNEIVELDEKNELKMAALKEKMKLMSNLDKDASKLWVQSYDLRKIDYAALSSISDIFDEWVFLKQNGSEKFIDIDFDMMFPGKKDNLINTWDMYRHKLLIYYNTNLKDNQFKALFEEMQANATDKDSEDCILIALLNAVLKPTHRHIEMGPDSKRTIRKTSINDAINSFILHLPVLKDLEYALEGRSSVQPFIIVVGLKLSQLREFYISIGNTVLKTANFLSALDLCFKIFHVFDLNYSKESLLVWIFLQKFIYEINTIHDIKNPAIAEFIATLQNI